MANCCLDGPTLADLTRTVRLANGARVYVRPIRPDDEARLLALYERLSPRTVYQRFFSPKRGLPPDLLHAFAHVDYCDRFALVAEDDASDLVGVSRYGPADEPDVAEVAVVVEDRWQGRGLGPLLLDLVLRAAEANGIDRFRADALTENRPIFRVLSRLADVQDRAISHGVTTVHFRRRHG